jgi:hypothetical protein
LGVERGIIQLPLHYLHIAVIYNFNSYIYKNY